MQTNDSQDEFTIKPFHTRTMLAHPHVSPVFPLLFQFVESGTKQDVWAFSSLEWRQVEGRRGPTSSVQLLLKTPDIHMIKTTHITGKKLTFKLSAYIFECASLPLYIHLMSTLSVVLPCATIFNDGSWTFTVVRRKNNFNQDSGLVVSPIWSSLL